MRHLSGPDLGVFPCERPSGSVTLTVPGVPVTQPRQRMAKVAGFMRNYTPTTDPVNAFKGAIRIAWDNATDQPPLAGPVRLTVEFVLPRTQTRPAKVPKTLWNTGRVVMPCKPDLDNMLKAVKDALNKLAWHDDGQVWQVMATKQYAGEDEQPHATITVQPEAD